LYRDIDEFQYFMDEAPVPTSRLWALLGYLGITTALEFCIKRVPHLGRVEYRAIMEVFHGSAFRASCSDGVANVAWQAIIMWNCTQHCKLKNSIYHILPQRKKDKFKDSGVKTSIPRM
jgi:hypothetical protein